MLAGYENISVLHIEMVLKCLPCTWVPKYYAEYILTRFYYVPVYLNLGGYILNNSLLTKF